MKIVLATANARYIHASLALRYLLANSGEFRSNCRLLEFTLEDQAITIAEKILLEEPQLIALSVYIWNVDLLTEVVSIIKTVAKEIPLVLGGPEVSYEQERQEICRMANYVVSGAGELVWLPLLQQLAADNLPHEKLLAAPPDALKRLNEINFPYDEYSDIDIKKRVVYLEASRGCPFKCEFCLSALDVSAFNFPQEQFMLQLEKLWQRGLRSYKFVDRTFNLHPQVSLRILDFFLNKWQQYLANKEKNNLAEATVLSANLSLNDNNLPTTAKLANLDTDDGQFFAHFEMIPDNLPEALKGRISQFPEGSLQLEIGIQSWQVNVQENISRKQNNQKTIDNLLWLISNSQAHLHCDLIIGLPGESWQSFAHGFSKLWRLNVEEIQVGILKRLRGTPIIRHDQNFAMRYAAKAPYSLLANAEFSFLDMQRLKRFARFWDMIANSGRFKQTLAILLNSEQAEDDAPFTNFLALSEYLYTNYQRTHQYSLESLFDGIYDYARAQTNINQEQVLTSLISDYQRCGARGNPKILQSKAINPSRSAKSNKQKRQAMHQKN